MRRRLRLAGALLVTLTVAGCGDSNGGDEDEVRSMVLETCAPGGDAAAPVETAVCECAYDTLLDRFDADDLERLDRRLRDDPETVPAEVQEAVLDCTFEQVEPAEPKPSSSTSSSTTSTSRP